MVESNTTLEIAGERIGPGESKRFEIPVARLVTGTQVAIPVQVVNGAHPGRSLWMSAAIHGDELNGLEVIRRVLLRVNPATMAGLLITVPIVNVFGFIQGTRYLPDRRDLNRSFPGSRTGSLAARVANLFLEQIVGKCAYGIDLHTGSDRRTNLPQIRADLEDPETLRCARAFGTPVMIHARLRDGSLREAATSRGCHTLVYEGGEAERFDGFAIDAGVNGCLRVMAALGMIDPPSDLPKKGRAFRPVASFWVRARKSGIFHCETALGQRVREGQRVGAISDPFGGSARAVHARGAGVVIGLNTHPLVNRGDALVHVGEREGPPPPPRKKAKKKKPRPATRR